MRNFTVSTLLVSLVVLLVPSSTLALEGVGPRIFVTGTIQEIRISKKQAFDQLGGELTLKATNGQMVTVVIQDTASIISQGRLSRKTMNPGDLRTGMLVRTNGWRVDSKTITASLIIVLNVELNPALSANGIIQSVEATGITVLSQDGTVRSYKVTNETQVNISYDLYGPVGLTLVGKQVLMTLNPDDSGMIRVLRITGTNVSNVQTPKPTTVDMGRRVIEGN
ncbi:MAG: hypothetical protein PHZ00_03915 [Candidatus Peribacteraceae bacterium]|nr:hypothetical protein [Candidatus Peribacteraceae bacterium]